MTVLSLVRPPWSWPPGGELWLRTLFGLGRKQSPSKIRGLSSIHFARLAIITRIPDRGQGKEAVGGPLMLFESNYDGSFDRYIDVFAAAIPAKMYAFWGTSRGFPGVRPVTPFKRYISANEFGLAHYYAAYPDASITMVTSALRLKQRLAEFDRRTRGLDDAAFAVAYRNFLTEVQNDL
jgi:hypothetical protein